MFVIGRPQNEWTQLCGTFASVRVTRDGNDRPSSSHRVGRVRVVCAYFLSVCCMSLHVLKGSHHESIGRIAAGRCPTMTIIWRRIVRHADD